MNVKKIVLIVVGIALILLGIPFDLIGLGEIMQLAGVGIIIGALGLK